MVATVADSAGNIAITLSLELETLVKDSRPTLRRAILAAELFVLLYAVAYLCLWGSAKRSLADSGYNPEANIDQSVVGALWRHGISADNLRAAGRKTVVVPLPVAGEMDRRAGLTYLKKLDMEGVRLETHPQGSFQRGVAMLPHRGNHPSNVRRIGRFEDIYFPAYLLRDGTSRALWAATFEVARKGGDDGYIYLYLYKCWITV